LLTGRRQVRAEPLDLAEKRVPPTVFVGNVRIWGGSR
jgi:hypothetical protein